MLLLEHRRCFFLKLIVISVPSHVYKHDSYEDEDTEPKLNCLNIRTFKSKVVCCTLGVAYFTMYISYFCVS